ncbi:hypothetical protein [Actinacidiphila yeochonensis]|uniref:hypothetical protein n=1 Tax=Actinacidiphila yeochonensis TaxID=89050 RepID=UPI0005681E46|nr:hypothetical protein [Actinacidiphila yeochonensis]
MNNSVETTAANEASSATKAHSPFWLTDPETRARIHAAVGELVAVTYWAVQDEVTFLEALDSLADSTCDGLKLSRVFAPLIQARAAAFAAQWQAEYAETVDPLGEDFLRYVAAFEGYPSAVQANLLDAYDDRCDATGLVEIEV